MSNQTNDGAQESAAPDSETERVVKAYAKLLEQKTDAIVSEARLPFPKPIIKAALKAETLAASNPKFSLMASTCFRQLAGFRTEADAALWRSVASQETPSEALAESEQGRALESAWRNELNELAREWQAFLKEQGLSQACSEAFPGGVLRNRRSAIEAPAANA